MGKWHLGFFKEDYLPYRRGFDTAFGGSIESERNGAGRRRGREEKRKKEKKRERDREREREREREKERESMAGRQSEINTQRKRDKRQKLCQVDTNKEIEKRGALIHPYVKPRDTGWKMNG